MPERQLRMIREDLDGLPEIQLPKGYTLRTYLRGDESAWADIMNTGIGDAWTREKCREFLTGQPQFRPNSLFFIIHDGLPVGSACAWTETPEERVTGQIHMVCVKPGHRGKRLGGLLTLAVLGYMRDNGFTASWLGTDDCRMPAIKAYLDLGFSPDFLDESHRLRWADIFTTLGMMEQWRRRVFPGPRSQEVAEAVGNRAVLLVLDHTQRIHYDAAKRRILPYFHHIGIPYRVLDLGVDREPSQSLDSHVAIVLAQEKIGDSLSESLSRRVAQFVNTGGGLISFDRYIDAYPASLRTVIPLGTSRGQMTITSIQVHAGDHFITKYQEPYQLHAFRSSVAFTAADSSPDGDMLIQADARLPGLVAGPWGEGRVVQLLLGQELLDREHLGPCEGVDDLFWRSVAWAARKPFVMKAMPRFVTWRVYDVACRGGFQRIQDLADLGWRPHLSLWTEEIEEEQWGRLSELVASRRMDCMPQALRSNASIYFDDADGRPLTEPDLAAGIDRAFGALKEHGIVPARSVHIQQDVYGRNALPLLISRDVCYGLCHRAPSDHTGDFQLGWEPSPYGHPRYISDRLFGFPELFVSVSGEPADSLVRRTQQEETVAERVARDLRISLTSRFHGSVVLSERSIASFSDEAWASLLHQVDRLVAEFRALRVSQDTACKYAEDKSQIRLARVHMDTASDHLQLTIDGEASLPIEVQVYDESCTEHALKIESGHGGDDLSFDLRDLFASSRTSP